LSSEDSNSSLEINHANNLLGNNLLHPVTSTTKSQQNLAQSFDAVATSKTPPIAATKMNLNHPVNLNTTSSGTHPNIMVNERCHNLQTKITKKRTSKSNALERLSRGCLVEHWEHFTFQAAPEAFKFLVVSNVSTCKFSVQDQSSVSFRFLFVFKALHFAKHWRFFGTPHSPK
jgi:hypothetical protein